MALLGTNGAGKSTVLRAISGLSPASAGTVHVRRVSDITSADPNTTARLGITQVPGGRGVFPTLTVEENLRAAAWLLPQGQGARRAKRRRACSSIFPALHGTVGDTRGQPVGRRATDAQPRPSVPGSAEAPHDRRALAWPGAGDRRPAARDRPRNPSQRHHDPRRRTVGAHRAAPRRARRVPREGRGALLGSDGGADRAQRHPARRVSARRGRRSKSRRAGPRPRRSRRRRPSANGHARRSCSRRSRSTRATAA